MPTKLMSAREHLFAIEYLLDTDEGARPLRAGERRLGRYVLPDFQRPFVWTEQQQVRFIESVFLGLDLGRMCVTSTMDSDYNGPLDDLIIDGQQRLTTLDRFYRDQFPVRGLRFSELHPGDQRRFLFTVFPQMVLTEWNGPLTRETVMDLYDRLAHGGTPHEPKTPKPGLGPRQRKDLERLVAELDRYETNAAAHAAERREQLRLARAGIPQRPAQPTVVDAGEMFSALKLARGALKKALKL
jgi:hypothetical protein